MVNPTGPRDEGQELMLRVKHGDDSAFETLVGMYQPAVYSTAYRFLGNTAAAEDLAQEVFLRVYRARQRYEPLARFSTWLFRILHNLIINQAAARSKAGVSLEGLGRREDGAAAMTVADPDAEEPLAVLEREELLQKVRESVLALPEKQRMALVMHKYQDMSYAEIAAAMGSSMEAIKSMLFRARDNVRAKLVRYLKVEAADEV